jgi:beta-N-acetylhexosaminidase
MGVLALLGACGGSDDSDDEGTPTATATSSPPTPTQAAASPTAAPTQPPSVEEMIGQMLMLGFRGTELTANPIVADIRDRHAGGVVLFSRDVPTGGTRNIESPAQVAALTSALQETSGGRLLIAVDQEGGQVARLGPEHGFPATRSAEELGRIDDLGVTSAAAGRVADTLVAAGFNLNLAPVVDLNTNPANPIIGAIGRSFGADPALVTRHAEAFIDAHHERGPLTALKHFPGHGSSRADSHLGVVDVTETWDPVELEPFRALLAAGKADMVMVAHLFNANLDATYPASLSAETIDGLLRRDLGFEGVVISDDMQMGAITQEYGFEEAIRLAVLAGNDILVLGNNLDTFDPEVGARAFGVVRGLVDAGNVSSERIGESYGRIMALKSRLG